MANGVQAQLIPIEDNTCHNLNMKLKLKLLRFGTTPNFFWVKFVKLLSDEERLAKQTQLQKEGYPKVGDKLICIKSETFRKWYSITAGRSYTVIAFIALGTSSTTPTMGDLTLGGEITTSGLG